MRAYKAMDGATHPGVMPTMDECVARAYSQHDQGFSSGLSDDQKLYQDE